MGKEIIKKQADKKGQERQNKLLSFVGGLVFFTAIMAVVVYKDEDVRQELGTQAKGLLKTSKEAIQQVRFVAGRLGKVIRGVTRDKDGEDAAVDGKGEEPRQYDGAWAAYESQNPDHVKNRLSG
jgi:hypothetical protein